MNIQECLNILELDETATPSEVKKAYKELVQIWHPDKYLSNSQDIQQRVKKKIQELNFAYEQITLSIKSGQFGSSVNDYIRKENNSSKQGNQATNNINKYHLRSYPVEVDYNNFSETYFGLVQDEINKYRWIPDKIVNNVFIDNRDYTFTDLATGLMWHKWVGNIDSKSIKLSEPGCVTRLIDDCNSYISRLNTEKFRNWRLPTIDELLSLIEPIKRINKDGSQDIWYQISEYLISTNKERYVDDRIISADIFYEKEYENTYWGNMYMVTGLGINFYEISSLIDIDLNYTECWLSDFEIIAVRSIQ